MHKKLKKCLKCGQPMHLIPMKTGKFHCIGWRAQCTDCGFGHNMRDTDYSQAIRQYNMMKPMKRKKRKMSGAKKVYFMCLGISVLFCGLSIITIGEGPSNTFLTVCSYFGGFGGATALFGFKR